MKMTPRQFEQYAAVLRARMDKQRLADAKALTAMRIQRLKSMAKPLRDIFSRWDDCLREL